MVFQIISIGETLGRFTMNLEKGKIHVLDGYPRRCKSIKSQYISDSLRPHLVRTSEMQLKSIEHDIDRR